MYKYILRRIALFVPTLFAISLLTFLISLYAPGDPVEARLQRQAEDRPNERQAKEQAYRDLRKLWGLDKPVFYFTITNSTVPDTLHHIPLRKHRETMERLSFEYGSWENVDAWHSALKSALQATYAIDWTAETAAGIRAYREKLKLALSEHRESKLEVLLEDGKLILNDNNYLHSLLGPHQQLQNAFENMVGNAAHWRRYVPTFHWYGSRNQYHTWLFGDQPWFGDRNPSATSYGLVRGDFGVSYTTLQPVSSEISSAMRWTVWIAMLSLLIAFFTAVPLGVLTATKRGTMLEKLVSTKLFALYSLPNFWVATLLIIYFGGGDYLDWFPAFGVGDLPESAPFWERFWDAAWHLVLPTICWTYASLAIISRQMRSAMLNQLGQDYIRTAHAKGLNSKAVIWRHAARNSLLPMITILGMVFPLAVAGSVVIETIFSIPGMGRLTIDAYAFRNYPIIFSGTMLIGALTLVGTLVADILYALADPRVSYRKTTS